MSPFIKTGLNQPNVIAVDADGKGMTFYVNLKPIAHIQDGHYNSGNIGFMVGQPDDESVTDVAYTYARVWTF